MSQNIHITENWLTQTSGKNLFDKSKVTNFTFINASTGEAESKDSYFSSDFIPVTENTTYITACIRSWAVYNSNKEHVSSGLTDILGVTKIKVPSNGAYLRFSSYPSNLNTIQLEVNETDIPSGFEEYNTIILSDNVPLLNKKQLKQTSNNPLYGKKWCVIGDSFTSDFEPQTVKQDDDKNYTFAVPADWKFSEGHRFEGQSKTYSKLIADRNDMQLQFLAKSGRTLAYPADGQYTVLPFTYDRTSDSSPKNQPDGYKGIEKDADYITIMLGANDEHKNPNIPNNNVEKGIIPLGEPNDTDRTTFYGAWNVVLTYLIENCPRAHIGIIVENAFTEGSGYREATIKMAKKYGIPYIDLNGDQRTRAMFRTVNSDVSDEVKDILIKQQTIWPEDGKDTATGKHRTKNLHPNKMAHAIEADIIENFLRSL